MSRERRPGLGGASGRTTSTSGGFGVPGKRTLTQGLVQRKARAAATMDPPPVYDESRATIDLGGGAAAMAGAGEVGHGDERAGRAPATIDAPAAWDESLGRPTIAISGGAAGEGDGAGAGEVAAGGAAEPGWVQRARAYHEAHAAEAAAFERLTGGACAGDDGALDPRKVARWQVEHGVAPDGRVGEATLDAARAAGRGAGTSGGGGDRSAVSEPASIDARARYDEVDRGTLEVGGAVQRRATQTGPGEGTADPVAVAAAGVEGASQPLPHLDAIQASFGPHDVTGVRAQVGGAAAEASNALGAEAYATGDRVGFAASPSLHTAAHEAAHVVQQRAGVSLKGGVGEAGDAYEQHADAVADAVVRGDSAEPLLSPAASLVGPAALQRKSGKERVADTARAHELAEVGLPPRVVDDLVTGTPVIHKFVERSMKAGMKADGMTFFYDSTEAMAQGMAKRWSRVGFDEHNQPYELSEEQVLAAARAKARESVAATLILSDNTIHVLPRAEGFSFRTLLHEAMHQQVRFRGAQLGFSANEGLAEYLSEIILREHGLSFTPYAQYRRGYDFIMSLEAVFGRDLILRFALQDGVEVLSDEYKRYADDGADGWNEFMERAQMDEFGRARAYLDDHYLSQRRSREPEERAAEQGNAEFWEQATEFENEQREAHERSTWPEEARGVVEGRITNVAREGALFGRLTVSRGGRHGVRDGWVLEFDTSSEMYPEIAFVVEVRSTACDVLMSRPFEELARMGGQRVFMRRP